jgi:hypothetical protein
MPNLDGTEKLTPTPFDAHEKVVRGSHEHTKDGYVAKEYKHQEYPKAVFYDKETGEPVVAKDAKHEAQLVKARHGKVVVKKSKKGKK